MSLGPPFDASGLRLQQAVGAGVVLVLAAATGWVLFFSDRTLGRRTTFHVEMRTAGARHTGARVMLAGREIGEVRSVATVRARSDAGLHADICVFVSHAQ